LLLGIADDSLVVIPPSILFIHADIYGFGGAEIQSIRAIQVAQEMGATVTLVHTGGKLDSDRIRAWSGIALDPKRVRFVSVPGARIVAPLIRRFALLQYSLALRWARRLAHEYDAVATTYGECTVRHRNVVQYIHYPMFYYDRESLQHLGNYYHDAFQYRLRVFYHRLCRAIAGWRRVIVRGHVTLANSCWTASQIRRLYGDDLKIEALYPGATVTLKMGDPDFLPFEKRQNNLVMVGRLVPGKRPELAVEIVSRLRQEKGHDVGLVLIGRAAEPYASTIRSLIADKPWIVWHQNLDRHALEIEVAAQKWGLHCYPFEHYGIAPLELQMLGCITFVPGAGGQKEIVVNPQLQYSDCADAVEKIDRVMRDPGMHSGLRDEAARINLTHEAAAFSRRYREILSKALMPFNSTAAADRKRQEKAAI
jgi:glycosyltransferase involved in cell wall biosynthesis